MMKRWLWVALLLVLAAASAAAETVHLNTGESIKGTIVGSDEDTITIESAQGFGTIRVERSEIVLIEFDENERDLSRRLGLGYYHRTVPADLDAGSTEYGTDGLSLKMWLDRDSAMEMLVGFYSAAFKGETTYEVFSLDLRYSSVVKRRGNLDLYLGGSVGYLNVTDRRGGADIEETGSSLRGFAGTEIFFDRLPDLGISAEISVGSQQVGDRSVTNLSATPFPSFAVRYYF